MDMGIVNALQVKADVYEKLDKELLQKVEDVLLNRSPEATEAMLEYAATLDPKSRPCALNKLQAEVRNPLSAAYTVFCMCFAGRSAILCSSMKAHRISLPAQWSRLRRLTIEFGLLLPRSVQHLQYVHCCNGPTSPAPTKARLLQP